MLWSGVLELKKPTQDGYYFASSGQCPTVLEIAAAAAHGATIVPETDDESRARVGGNFADALLTDQQASGAAACHHFSWAPQRPSLVLELKGR